MNAKKQFNAISARNALHAARAARDSHQEVCTSWDYEGSDCLECADLETRVQRAAKHWSVVYARIPADANV